MFKSKNRYWLALIMLVFAVSVQAQTAKVSVKQEGVTINNTGSSTADPSAVLHVDALNKGVLFPRLTTIQRDVILNPAEGLLIYNLTNHIYEFFNGTEWRELGLIVPTVPTPAPTNLVASALSSTQIDLTWTDNATNETGFLVERKLATEQTWTSVITLAADITTYTDDNEGAGLSIGTSYLYRVRSLTNSGGDGYSNEANATTFRPFVSRWKTDKPGVSGANQVQLPLEVSGSYNFMVDWGDGNSSTITAYNQAEITHTYASAGEYTVAIEGQLDGWRFGNQGDQEKLLEISAWGELLLGNNGGYFHGCSNLIITATDELNSGDITNFHSAWRRCSSLTSFPVIDVSSGTNFQYAWEYNTSLTSFPALDMPAATNLYVTWRGNTSMTSFGALTNTSQVTVIANAWEGCSSLSSFPYIETSSITNFHRAWMDCSSLTSFPLLNTTAGTTFSGTWQNCSSLTTFPLIDTQNGINFISTWYKCSSLTTFPDLDVSSGTNFTQTWSGNSSLQTFPTLDVSSGTNFTNTWAGNSSLQSFPVLDTSAGTSFESAWRGCTSLTSFPLIDVSQGTNFINAWRDCTSLTTLPNLVTTSATNFTSICEGCASLTSFPALNTSNVTSFRDAFRGCSSLTSFPLIDTSAGTNFNHTWRNCTSLTSFPTLDLGAMTTGIGAFTGTNIGTTNYSNLLIDINSKNSNTNVTFNGGNATYNATAASARTNLISNGWTITDGGAN